MVLLPSVGLGREACLSGCTVSGSGLEVEEPEKPEDSPCWSGSAWLMLRKDLHLSPAFAWTSSLSNWLGQVALTLQSLHSLSYPTTGLEASGEEQGIVGSGVDGSDSTLSIFVQLPLADSSMDDCTVSCRMISYLRVGYCIHRQGLHHDYWLLANVLSIC